MADAPAPSPMGSASTARNGTAITNVAVFLGYLFDCHQGGWHVVDPSQAQEAVLALGVIVAWDWVKEIFQHRAMRKAARASRTRRADDVDGAVSLGQVGDLPKP